jgi:hypothetical protein
MKRLAIVLVCILLIVAAMAIYKRIPEPVFLVILGGGMGVLAAIPLWFATQWVMNRQEQISEANNRPEAQPQLTVNNYGTMVLGSGARVVSGLPAGMIPFNPQYLIGDEYGNR